MGAELNTAEFITILAGSNVLNTGVTLWGSRRKSNNDAAEVITRAATALVSPLTERINGLEDEVRRQHARDAVLEERVTSQDARIKFLEEGIAALTRQIEELGHKPVWPLVKRN